jgi:hypothetical protein
MRAYSFSRLRLTRALLERVPFYLAALLRHGTNMPQLLGSQAQILSIDSVRLGTLAITAVVEFGQYGRLIVFLLPRRRIQRIHDAGLGRQRRGHKRLKDSQSTAHHVRYRDNGRQDSNRLV